MRRLIAGFIALTLFGCTGFNNSSKSSSSLASLSAASHGLNTVIASPVFNVLNYGALGNGHSDDTQAIQSAINAAEQAQGGVVFFPMGNYVLTSNLSITSGLSIRGLGYQGAFSNINVASGSVPALPGLPDCSCIFQTNPNASVFVVTTTDAVQFQNFVIYYPSATPYSGATGIQISGGYDVGNSQSLIRDVLIYGADRGISFTNAVSWVVDNDVIYNSQTYGLNRDTTFDTSSFGTAYGASAGDWQISNTTFASSVRNNSYASILLLGGGGGRITLNRMITNGFGYGVLVAPAHYLAPINDPVICGSQPVPCFAGGYNIEPNVIVSNSIEGANFGVAFIGAPGNNGTSSLGVITDNQIWANTDIYSQQGPIVNEWVDGWSIYGNSMNCLSSTAYCINMNGASGINIVSNTFYLSSGAQTTWFGADTDKIQVADNTTTSGTSQPRIAGYGAQSPSSQVQSYGLLGYPMASLYNVRAYGAKGDGITDDTRAIQNAINAAEASDGTVFFPNGKFIISATLSITASLTIQGIGYQSAGTDFVTTSGAATPVSFAALHSCSCIIQQNANASIFSANTSGGLQFLDLELFYNVPGNMLSGANPFSGAAAIQIIGASANSLIRDVFIQGADRGIYIANTPAFTIDNAFIYDSATYGLMIDGTAANSGGWQLINSTFATGTNQNYSHIQLLGGGGGKIVANKLNAAGSGSQPVMNGITFAPSHYAIGGFQIDPVYIIGNSIEGEYVGISFYGMAGNDGIASNGAIIGNQIWAFVDIQSVAGPTYPEWVQHWTISGNTLNSQGKVDSNNKCAATGITPAYNINLDGIYGLNLVGNMYSSVCAPDSTTYFGANTAGIQSYDNLIDE